MDKLPQSPFQIPLIHLSDILLIPASANDQPYAEFSAAVFFYSLR